MLAELRTRAGTVLGRAGTDGPCAAAERRAWAEETAAELGGTPAGVMGARPSPGWVMYDEDEDEDDDDAQFGDDEEAGEDDEDFIDDDEDFIEDDEDLDEGGEVDDDDDDEDL